MDVASGVENTLELLLDADDDEMRSNIFFKQPFYSREDAGNVKCMAFHTTSTSGDGVERTLLVLVP